MTSPIRAAIYTRVSTEDQVKNTSLDEQTRQCLREAERREWQVVGEYQDAGISGTRNDRPAWRQMLADARAGKLDRLIVLNLSRFSRNSGDTITQARALLELGVSLVSVQESFDVSSPSGRAMLGMQAVFWEFDRDQIITKTVAGQRARAQEGGWPGGEPPFGWRLEGTKRDARPVRDDREREVIEAAHRLFVKRRLSTGQVADRLNEAGLHPRKGGRWEYQTVRQMMTRSSLWDGIYRWGHPDGRSAGHRSHHTKLDRDGNPLYGPTIEVLMGEPPLSRTEYNAVQRALARRSINKALSPSVTQLLAGRIFGGCGKHYNGATLTARGRAVYRCSGGRHKGKNNPDKCSCRSFEIGLVDEPVWAEIMRLLSDPDRLETMARQWLEVPEGSDMDDVTMIVAGLNKQIESKRRALERAKDDLYDSDDPDEHRVRIERYRAELADLTERRSGYAALQADSRLRAERLTDLARLAERAEGRLRDMPLASRREVIELLDVRVEVAEWDDGRPVGLNITGQIDPRLFGDGTAPGEPADRHDDPFGGNTNVGGSSCRWCSSSCRSRSRSRSSRGSSCCRWGCRTPHSFLETSSMLAACALAPTSPPSRLPPASPSR